MKAQLTRENKHKFFAQYWGQEVLRDDNGDLYYVCNDSIGDPTFSQWLELTPLSMISDEDAIEIAEIIYPYNVREGVSSKAVKDIKEFLKLKWSYGGGSEGGHWSGNYFCYWDYIKVTDLLRSKGYVLPWMGLSVEEMVEACWIKLKEK